MKIGWDNWNNVTVFDGLHPEDYEHDDPNEFIAHGDPMWRDLIEQKRPKVILEVGTYRGRTAIFMAHLIKKLGLDAKVVCVDTWVGSPEHWRRDQDPYWQLKLKFGFPMLYYTFAANVVLSGLKDYIVPLPSTSESAANILRNAGLTPDVIFVDAAHEFEPALRDFRAYWDLLASNGFLVGDDYLGPGWDSVTEAGNTFAAEIGKPLASKVGKFIVSKGSQTANFKSDGGLEFAWFQE